MELGAAKIQLIGSERISKVLFQLGLPTMIGLLISALYNVVDTFFVARIGTSQAAAVSIVFPIGEVIIGIGIIFGSGAASYISRLLGEGDRVEADRVASTALFTSLIIGTAVIIFILIFLERILILLGAIDTILPYAKRYGRIFFAGSVLTILNVTINNIIVAEGTTKLTMIAMITGAILNVILDAVFIFVLNWNIEGAAIASVISQLVTSGVYIWHIIGKRGALRFHVKNLIFCKRIYLEIMKVGIPGFLFQFLSSIAMGLTNTSAAVYGDAAVAAMGIVTKILALGNYVIFGFMRGFQPLAGYSYGAGLYGRLRESLRTSIKWTSFFCGGVAAILYFFAAEIMSAFSKSDPMIAEIGIRALRINSITFLFFGVGFTYGVFFLAIGRIREGSILSISRQGVFFIPLIFSLPRIFGLDGVILAQPIADACTFLTTLIMAFCFHRDFSKVRKRSLS